MKKTYQGGCHCGAVRFEATLDLAAGTSRCNCSICAKGRFWKAIVGKDEFRLLQGADALAEYKFGNHVIAHRFCTICGIKPFGRGEHEQLGGEFFGVNIACLDASDDELAAARVTYENGRENDWSNPPRVTAYL